MSSSVLAVKKSAAKASAWKLVVALLRQQPKGAGEYHIVRVEEVLSDMVPDYEQLGRIVDAACSVSIHVVDEEEAEHTFMPLFHSIGRRGTPEGDNVVARFHTLADAELYLLRQGLAQFAADAIPTEKQLNAAIESEGLILTLRMGR